MSNPKTSTKKKKKIFNLLPSCNNKTHNNKEKLETRSLNNKEKLETRSLNNKEKLELDP
jgi:hypothetical protein